MNSDLRMNAENLVRAVEMTNALIPVLNGDVMMDVSEVAKAFLFSEEFRPQFAKMAGMSGDPHWGDIATVLSAKIASLEAGVVHDHRDRESCESV